MNHATVTSIESIDWNSRAEVVPTLEGDLVDNIAKFGKISFSEGARSMLAGVVIVLEERAKLQRQYNLKLQLQVTESLIVHFRQLLGEPRT